MKKQIFMCGYCGKKHDYSKVKKGNFSFQCPTTNSMVHISNKLGGNKKWLKNAKPKRNAKKKLLKV